MMERGLLSRIPGEDGYASIELTLAYGLGENGIRYTDYTRLAFSRTDNLAKLSNGSKPNSLHELFPLPGLRMMQQHAGIYLINSSPAEIWPAAEGMEDVRLAEAAQKFYERIR